MDIAPAKRHVLFPKPICQAVPTARRWCPHTVTLVSMRDEKKKKAKLTVGRVPAHDDRHGGVGAHRSKEKGPVLEVDVVVHDEQDDESRERNRDQGDDEEEALSQQVGECCSDHRHCEGTCPGRDR